MIDDVDFAIEWTFQNCRMYQNVYMFYQTSLHFFS
jgi:hypothetical protein